MSRRKAEDVNRFAEAKLSDLSFDFGAMRPFAHKRHVNVGTVEAGYGLNNVAMAFIERELCDHSDEFVVWRKFKFIPDTLNVGRRNARGRELFQIDPDARHIEEGPNASTCGPSGAIQLESAGST